jgi:L-fuconolactonase
VRRGLTRIDAHHHLWRYNDRDYVWMSELEQVLAPNGIGGTVTVQARQTIAETGWLLELARTTEIIRGVVGWIRLPQPDLRESLEEFAGNPKLKGVRHVPHDEPGDDYLLRDDCTWIRARAPSPSRELLRELAQRENVYCKVSGMVTEADWNAWTPTDLLPYFEVVLSAYDPKRLMFGSDWPVLNLAADYARWVETAVDAYGLNQQRS